MCCDLPEVTQLAGAELGLHPGLSGIEPHHLPPFPSVQDPFLFKNSLPSVYSNLSPGPSSGAVHARPRYEKTQFCSCVCALLGHRAPIFQSSFPQQQLVCLSRWSQRGLKKQQLTDAQPFPLTFTFHGNWEGSHTSWVCSPSRWAPGFCSTLCQQSSHDLGFLPSLFWTSAFPCTNEGDPQRAPKEWN